MSPTSPLTFDFFTASRAIFAAAWEIEQGISNLTLRELADYKMDDLDHTELKREFDSLEDKGTIKDFVEEICEGTQFSEVADALLNMSVRPSLADVL